jgi:hypothetical protein
MESQVKKLLPIVRYAMHSLVAVVLLAMVALPLSADTITVKSDATNVGANVGSPYDSSNNARLTSGDTSGLTFSLVGTVPTGSWVAAPSGAPAGTIQVQIPPQPPSYDPNGHNTDGNSGFVETTFNLPAVFYGVSLSGRANVDDWGYVFLNGHLISGDIKSTSSLLFGTINAAYFLPGVNTLVISDSNWYGGPSGVAFYANINYSLAPEPTSMLMLATGLLGLAGAIRRKLA